MLKNRYYRGSKLSEAKFLNVLKAFCDGESASQAAPGLGLSVRAVNQIFVELRQRLRARVYSAPEAFDGAGQRIKGGITDASLATESARERQIVREYKEIVSVAGGAMASRIQERSIREDHYLDHLTEIYVRCRLDGPCRSASKIDLDVAYEDAAIALKGGDRYSFKHIITRLPRTQNSLGAHQSRMWKEMQMLLMDDPL